MRDRLASGPVTCCNGAGALGTASVTGGAAPFSLNSLGLGSHSLSASYGGDASNQASSSNSVSLTVNPRAGMTWQYGYDAMGRINTMVDLSRPNCPRTDCVCPQVTFLLSVLLAH